MSSGESRTHLSSALQKGLIVAQRVFCWLIPIQQWTVWQWAVWAISLLLAANMVLFSTWVAILSTKAITETRLFSSGLLPHLSTLTILAWLLPDIRSWLLKRISYCWRGFRDAMKQLCSCKPWKTKGDAIQCQPEIGKEEPLGRIVAVLILLWLGLAAWSAIEHVELERLSAPDWSLLAAWWSRVRAWLSAPDWSAWWSRVLPAAWIVSAVLAVALWNKRQPPTDKNGERNERSVSMAFWNYGRKAMTWIVTVLLMWTLMLVHLIASGGLMLTWIGDNVKNDGVQRDKITNSVDSLLQNHFPRYLFEEETVFALLFQKGDTTNMRGICPTGNNLEWLKLFKSAVGQCTARADTGADSQDTSRGRPQIEVSGLASVGPGHGDEDVDPDSAALLNLQIANMRTVSVAAVLLADSTPSTLDIAERKCLCGSSFSDPSLADTLTAHCEGARSGNPDHPIKLDEGEHFDVSYTLWSTYGAMHRTMPVNDEGTPADSVLEFLNRTVQITIQNDVCRY